METQCDSIKEILFSSIVGIYPDIDEEYSCTLTSEQIEIAPIEQCNENDSRNLIAKLHDIIGCDRMRGANTDDEYAYLKIHYYKQKKKIYGSNTTRKKEPITLVFHQSHHFSENQRTAEQWRIMLSRILLGYPTHCEDGTMVLKMPHHRKLLVFINPASGPGKALQLYKEKILPLLNEAGFHCTPFITEYPGHAKEEVENLKINDWYGLAIVSGDGLTYEVLNGLMNREDWNRAIKMPLAVLPGGSGNALCCSVNYAASETFMEDFALHSSFIVAKHKVRPLDLVAIDLGPQRLYSFLSFTWGLVAEIDIESDKLRMLGNARFTFGALYKLIALNCYHGKLSYLPITEESKKERKPITRRLTEYNDEEVKSESELLCQESIHRSLSDDEINYKSDNKNYTDLDKHDNILSFSQESQSSFRNQKLVRMNTYTENDKDDEGKKSSDSTESLSLLVNEDDLDHKTVDYFNDSNSNSNSLLNPIGLKLTDPIPENWVTLEGLFVSVAACYTSHLGPDTHLSPGAEFDDGIIHLTYMDKETTRNQALNSLTSKEDVHHITGGIKQVKVSAFRLVPTEGKSHMAIDGESVPCGPVQGQILPGLGRIMNK